MTTLSNTLLIRQSKHTAKRGMPKAVAYRHNIFDPAAEIESLIEAFGASKIKHFVDLIEARRLNELSNHPEHFKNWEL